MHCVVSSRFFFFFSIDFLSSHFLFGGFPCLLVVVACLNLRSSLYLSMTFLLVLWAFHPNVSILKDFFSGVIARL